VSSKLYSNKVCVYCRGVSTTSDHVVARTFFPNSMHEGIPKVPSCATCNNEKSKLEHYLATVLPIAGQHPVAKGIEAETVDRRLEKNGALKRELNKGYQEFREHAPPATYISTFRHDDLVRYTALMAQGLLFHHFNVVLGAEHIASGKVLHRHNGKTLDALYQDVANDVIAVKGNIACGAFTYRGFAVKGDLSTSIWHIRMYDGLSLGSNNNGIPSGPALLDLTAKTCLKEILLV